MQPSLNYFSHWLPYLLCENVQVSKCYVPSPPVWYQCILEQGGKCRLLASTCRTICDQRARPRRANQSITWTNLFVSSSDVICGRGRRECDVIMWCACYRVCVKPKLLSDIESNQQIFSIWLQGNFQPAKSVSLDAYCVFFLLLPCLPRLSWFDINSFTAIKSNT